MTNLKVLKFPDKILRRKSAEIERMGEPERRTLAEMAETMYLNKGVGLAAPQVGISKRLVVIDIGEGLVQMANPIILKKDGSDVAEEGCLSVPSTIVKIKRAKKVTVNFLNEYGDPKQVKADDIFARAIQHEIDHLDGKLIVDHLNPIKKLFLKRQPARR